ncbi:MAG: HNH endonuclease [Bacteroidota bacterium]
MQKIRITEVPVKKPRTRISLKPVKEPDQEINLVVEDEPIEPEPVTPEFTIEDANNEYVESLLDIINLDEKYRNATPEIKEILSKRIERGSFSNRFKQIAGYKCMICERMGHSPFSFSKPNGEYYIEVHHIIPVPEQIEVSTSSANLITVCANHHRQLHYGKSFIQEITDRKVVFSIDNKLCDIKKLSSLVL